MRPIIAITTYGRHEKDLSTTHYDHHFALPTLYIDAVRRAGGIPFLLPPGEEHLSEALALVDGVLISGGADINPAEYGGDVDHPALTRLDLERDTLEFELVRKLVNETPLPTLGICRGMQVMNVALGGSLHEHVPDAFPDDIHRSDTGGWTVQDVAVDPQSRLAEIMEADHVATYSGHHQGVKQLASVMTVSATAADGVVEAIEHAELPWMVGVQWHPEITAAEDPTQQRLFDELVREAAARRAAR